LVLHPNPDEAQYRLHAFPSWLPLDASLAAMAYRDARRWRYSAVAGWSEAMLSCELVLKLPDNYFSDLAIP